MTIEVYINSLGTFMPGPPVSSEEMEDYIGRINGQSSRHKALVLRQNKIKTRHYALDKNGNQLHSSAEMAACAVKDAIESSEISAEEITYLAASSTLGDVLVPGLASHIHAVLNLPPIELANFQSVCASSFMALKSGWLQLKAGEHSCAVITGSEFASRYFRPGFYENIARVQEEGKIPFESDFLRFTLSDGAGAMILENKPNERQLSLKVKWLDIRSYADRFATCMLAGGVRMQDEIRPWSGFPNMDEGVKAGALILTQDFDLMKKMIPVWVSHYLDLIDQGRIVIDEIDHVCSHYSSHSLREETINLLNKAGAMIDEGKWFSNLYTKGNTGAASIFIMLDELYRKGALQNGENILCHVPESGRAMNGFMLLEVV